MNEDKDLKVEFAPEAQAKIDSDPDAAAAVRDFTAMMRQAYDGVQHGTYPSMDAALKAFGVEMARIDADGNEIEGASLDDDMFGPVCPHCGERHGLRNADFEDIMVIKQTGAKDDEKN